MNTNPSSPQSIMHPSNEHLVREGDRIYEEKIKALVEPQFAGKYLAIDPESGDYFVGDTLIEAGEKGHDKYPGKILYIKRVGFKAVFHLHGVSGLRKEMFV